MSSGDQLISAVRGFTDDDFEVIADILVAAETELITLATQSGTDPPPLSLAGLLVAHERYLRVHGYAGDPSAEPRYLPVLILLCVGEGSEVGPWALLERLRCLISPYRRAAAVFHSRTLARDTLDVWRIQLRLAIEAQEMVTEANTLGRRRMRRPLPPLPNRSILVRHALQQEAQAMREQDRSMGDHATLKAPPLPNGGDASQSMKMVHVTDQSVLINMDQRLVVTNPSHTQTLSSTRLASGASNGIYSVRDGSPTPTLTPSSPPLSVPSCSMTSSVDDPSTHQSPPSSPHFATSAISLSTFPPPLPLPSTSSPPKAPHRPKPFTTNEHTPSPKTHVPPSPRHGAPHGVSGSLKRHDEMLATGDGDGGKDDIALRHWRRCLQHRYFKRLGEATKAIQEQSHANLIIADNIWKRNVMARAWKVWIVEQRTKEKERALVMESLVHWATVVQRSAFKVWKGAVESLRGKERQVRICREQRLTADVFMSWKSLTDAQVRIRTRLNNLIESQCRRNLKDAFQRWRDEVGVEKLLQSHKVKRRLEKKKVKRMREAISQWQTQTRLRNTWERHQELRKVEVIQRVLRMWKIRTLWACLQHGWRETAEQRWRGMALKRGLSALSEEMNKRRVLRVSHLMGRLNITSTPAPADSTLPFKTTTLGVRNHPSLGSKNQSSFVAPAPLVKSQQVRGYRPMESVPQEVRSSPLLPDEANILEAQTRLAVWRVLHVISLLKENALLGKERQDRQVLGEKVWRANRLKGAVTQLRTWGHDKGRMRSQHSLFITFIMKHAIRCWNQSTKQSLTHMNARRTLEVEKTRQYLNKWHNIACERTRHETLRIMLLKRAAVRRLVAHRLTKGLLSRDLKHRADTFRQRHALATLYSVTLPTALSRRHCRWKALNRGLSAIRGHVARRALVKLDFNAADVLFRGFGLLRGLTALRSWMNKKKQIKDAMQDMRHMLLSRAVAAWKETAERLNHRYKLMNQSHHPNYVTRLRLILLRRAISAWKGFTKRRQTNRDKGRTLLLSCRAPAAIQALQLEVDHARKTHDLGKRLHVKRTMTWLKNLWSSWKTKASILRKDVQQKSRGVALLRKRYALSQWRANASQSARLKQLGSTITKSHSTRLCVGVLRTWRYAVRTAIFAEVVSCHLAPRAVSTFFAKWRAASSEQLAWAVRDNRCRVANSFRRWRYIARMSTQTTNRLELLYRAWMMARRVRPLFDVWRSALARIQVLSSVATSHRNTLIDDRLKREGFARMLLAYGVAIRQRRRRLTDGMRALVNNVLTRRAYRHLIHRSEAWSLLRRTRDVIGRLLNHAQLNVAQRSVEEQSERERVLPFLRKIWWGKIKAAVETSRRIHQMVTLISTIPKYNPLFASFHYWLSLARRRRHIQHALLSVHHLLHRTVPLQQRIRQWREALVVQRLRHEQDRTMKEHATSLFMKTRSKRQYRALVAWREALTLSRHNKRAAKQRAIMGLVRFTDRNHALKASLNNVIRLRLASALAEWRSLTHLSLRYQAVTKLVQAKSRYIHLKAAVSWLHSVAVVHRTTRNQVKSHVRQIASRVRSEIFYTWLHVTRSRLLLHRCLSVAFTISAGHALRLWRRFTDASLERDRFLARAAEAAIHAEQAALQRRRQSEWAAEEEQKAAEGTEGDVSDDYDSDGSDDGTLQLHYDPLGHPAIVKAVKIKRTSKKKKKSKDGRSKVALLSPEIPVALCSTLYAGLVSNPATPPSTIPPCASEASLRQIEDWRPRPLRECPPTYPHVPLHGVHLIQRTVLRWRCLPVAACFTSWRATAARSRSLAQAEFKATTAVWQLRCLDVLHALRRNIEMCQGQKYNMAKANEYAAKSAMKALRRRVMVRKLMDSADALRRFVVLRQWKAKTGREVRLRRTAHAIEMVKKADMLRLYFSHWRSTLRLSLSVHQFATRVAQSRASALLEASFIRWFVLHRAVSDNKSKETHAKAFQVVAGLTAGVKAFKYHASLQLKSRFLRAVAAISHIRLLRGLAILRAHSIKSSTRRAIRRELDTRVVKDSAAKLRALQCLHILRYWRYRTRVRLIPLSASLWRIAPMRYRSCIAQIDPLAEAMRRISSGVLTGDTASTRLFLASSSSLSQSLASPSLSSSLLSSSSSSSSSRGGSCSPVTEIVRRHLVVHLPSYTGRKSILLRIRHAFNHWIARITTHRRISSHCRRAALRRGFLTLLHNARLEQPNTRASDAIQHNHRRTLLRTIVHAWIRATERNVWLRTCALILLCLREYRRVRRAIALYDLITRTRRAALAWIESRPRDTTNVNDDSTVKGSTPSQTHLSTIVSTLTAAFDQQIAPLPFSTSSLAVLDPKLASSLANHRRLHHTSPSQANHHNSGAHVLTSVLVLQRDALRLIDHLCSAIYSTVSASSTVTRWGLGIPAISGGVADVHLTPHSILSVRQSLSTWLMHALPLAWSLDSSSPEWPQEFVRLLAHLKSKITEDPSYLTMRSGCAVIICPRPASPEGTTSQPTPSSTSSSLPLSASSHLHIPLACAISPTLYPKPSTFLSSSTPSPSSPLPSPFLVSHILPYWSFAATSSRKAFAIQTLSPYPPTDLDFPVPSSTPSEYSVIGWQNSEKESDDAFEVVDFSSRLLLRHSFSAWRVLLHRSRLLGSALRSWRLTRAIFKWRSFVPLITLERQHQTTSLVGQRLLRLQSGIRALRGNATMRMHTKEDFIVADTKCRRSLLHDALSTWLMATSRRQLAQHTATLLLRVRHQDLLRSAFNVWRTTLIKVNQDRIKADTHNTTLTIRRAMHVVKHWRRYSQRRTQRKAVNHMMMTVYRRSVLSRAVRMLEEGRRVNKARKAMMRTASAVSTHLSLRRVLMALKYSVNEAMKARAKAATMITGRTTLIAKACLLEWRRLAQRCLELKVCQRQMMHTRETLFITKLHVCFRAWMSLCRVKRLLRTISVLRTNQQIAYYFNQWRSQVELQYDKQADSVNLTNTLARVLRRFKENVEDKSLRRNLARIQKDARAVLMARRTADMVGQWRTYTHIRQIVRDTCTQAIVLSQERKAKDALMWWKTYTKAKQRGRMIETEGDEVMTKMKINRAWRAWRFVLVKRRRDRECHLRPSFMSWVKGTLASMHQRQRIPSRVKTAFLEWIDATRRMMAIKRRIERTKKHRLLSIFDRWREHARQSRHAMATVTMTAERRALALPFFEWRQLSIKCQEAGELALTYHNRKQAIWMRNMLVYWRNAALTNIRTRESAERQRELLQRMKYLRLGLKVIKEMAERNRQRRQEAEVKADTFASTKLHRIAITRLHDWLMGLRRRRRHRVALRHAAHISDMSLARKALLGWRQAVTTSLLMRSGGDRGAISHDPPPNRVPSPRGNRSLLQTIPSTNESTLRYARPLSSSSSASSSPPSVSTLSSSLTTAPLAPSSLAAEPRSLPMSVAELALSGSQPASGSSVQTASYVGTRAPSTRHPSSSMRPPPQLPLGASNLTASIDPLRSSLVSIAGRRAQLHRPPLIIPSISSTYIHHAQNPHHSSDPHSHTHSHTPQVGLSNAIGNLSDIAPPASTHPSSFTHINQDSSIKLDVPRKVSMPDNNLSPPGRTPVNDRDITPPETPRTSMRNGALAISRLRLNAIKRARQVPSATTMHTKSSSRED